MKSMETSFEGINPFAPHETSTYIHEYEKTESTDITNPAVQRELFFTQDPRILEAVSELATKIKSCPSELEYEHNSPRALIVGGFARDALMGKHPKDADIEVYGISPNRLESFLDQLYGDRVNKVGRAFGIFKVAIAEGVDLDISIPRRESKTGPRHTDFDVQGDPSMTVKEAARRRDFTFNALAVDPMTGEYIDEFGGIEDIKIHTLRITDAERFQDDALRVLRGVQFTARMHLQVDTDTFLLMSEMVERGDLDILHQVENQGRITEEWKKLLLKSDSPSAGFNLATRLGILEKYYPELGAGNVGMQNGAGFDVMMQDVDRAAKILQSREQVFTENEQQQIICAALFAHAPDPEKIAKKFFSRTIFSTKDVVPQVQKILKMREEPEKIVYAIENEEITEKQASNEIRKLVKKLFPISPEVLLAVQVSTSRVSAKELFKKYLSLHPEWRKHKDFLITGEELIAMGVQAGKEMGILLKKIEDARDRGEVETREEALNLLILLRSL